ncbi:hypothetical protein GEMRC1_010064 [Eukaryota sp. GEM-RC1]
MVALLNVLKSNLPIKRVECLGLRSPSLEGLVSLFEIISTYKSMVNVDISPHITDVENGLFSYCPESSSPIATAEVSSLQSFLECFNIRELVLKNCNFKEDVLTHLCASIRVNASLTDVDFFQCCLPDNDSLRFLNVIQCICLRTIDLDLSDIEFKELLTVFDQFAIHSSVGSIILGPHSIDFTHCSIMFQNEVGNDDLISLLNALNSNLPIKRVECSGLRSPSLEGLINLFEILSINKSVMSVDISPHRIDIENDVFAFSPESSIRVTVDDLSPLQSLLNSSNIKELSLKRCKFSQSAFNVLCDLIRVNESLTSIDFSYIGVSDLKSTRYSDPDSPLISDHHLSKFISTLKSKFHLRKVNLSNSSIGFNNILIVFEMISTNTLTPNVKICPHSLNVTIGCIRYLNEINNDDLILLSKSLNSNLPIKRVEFCGLKSASLKGLITLFEILSLGKSLIDLQISPHIIDVENGVFAFSPESSTRVTAEDMSSLQSLFLNSTSIKELTLSRCSFSEDSFKQLCHLIRVNNSLTSIDFSHIRLSNRNSTRYLDPNGPQLSDQYLSKLISALKANSNLKEVNLSNSSVAAKLRLNFKICRHSLNYCQGFISYQEEAVNSDLFLLEKALNANLGIKRVQFLGLIRPSLKGLIVLLEILYIHKTEIDLDVAPHIVNVENAVFCFSPQRYTPVTAEDVTSLQCVLNYCSIKQLTLNRCYFTKEAITILCDLIRVNKSLISVNLSHCNLDDDAAPAFAFALEVNTSIESIDLSDNSFGSESAMTFITSTLERAVYSRDCTQK